MERCAVQLKYLQIVDATPSRQDTISQTVRLLVNAMSNSVVPSSLFVRFKDGKTTFCPQVIQNSAACRK